MDSVASFLNRGTSFIRDSGVNIIDSSFGEKVDEYIKPGLERLEDITGIALDAGQSRRAFIAGGLGLAAFGATSILLFGTISTLLSSPYLLTGFAFGVLTGGGMAAAYHK